MSPAKGERSAAYTGHRSRDALADQLSVLARSLQIEDDVQHTLDAIVGAVASTVPGAQHASLSTVRHRREVITRASTGQLARAVDQGPVSDGAGALPGRPVRVADGAAGRL